MSVFAGKIFENPVRILTAFDKKSFVDAFEKIEILRRKYLLLGYVRYEAKDIFLGKDVESSLPLLYFEVYENFAQTDFSPNSHENSFVLPETTLRYENYKKDVEEVKRLISEGETYEVNYTCDFDVVFPFDGKILFESLYSSQKTPYNAYIKNAYVEILSFSPELFFQIEDGKIRTKPMKGTVKRGLSPREDRENVEFLKNDVKNRAENVMIVDLLRNDLSKIAKTGSVRVPRLFDIETHPTVHQMTSEVEAVLKDGTSLYEVFSAIFPCGSITGAPKISTMKIIDNLEHGARNVYCGALGLISPEKIVFSVPIRILQRKIGEETFKYRVGGAIVQDSSPADEWDEIFVKSGFLTYNHQNFKIIETMKVEKRKAFLFESHIKRMFATASELNFKFPSELFEIFPEKDGIMRILLAKNGAFEVEYKPLLPILTNKVVVSPVKVFSKYPFLKYKTTCRPYYGSISGVFDELFFNEKNELTEGSRTNVLVQKNGVLYTPPLDCGLLDGTLRRNLLENGKIFEKKLYLQDLKTADKIYCINSVRGVKEVQLCL